MRRLDLHTHSHYSDGTSSPAEVARRARAEGVEVLVLTDHDTISGFREARAEGEALGLRVLCGVEINTGESDQLHILGYHVDAGSARLQERLEEFRARRRRRIAKVIDRLRAAGLDLCEDDLGGVSKQVVGRPHVADAMIRKGIVRSRKAAFDKYLMPGRPGYVEPMGPSPEEAISVIREAGGWASLAHPGSPGDGERLRRLSESGLRGVEAYYPTHSGETVRELLELAARYDLQATAGSDYHGPGTGRDKIGGIEVSPEFFDRLEAML